MQDTLPASADVVVIGAGIVGLTIAYELARASVPRIVVLDADSPGQQSTGRSSGGIRRQFGSALEIRLTEAALKVYGSMFSDPDFGSAFERDGYLFLAGPSERENLFETWQLQRNNGVPTEWLDHEALRDRYPFVDLSGISGATFCQDDGFIDPWAIVQWLLKRCRSLGVVIRGGRRVDRVDVEQRCVRAVGIGGDRIVAPLVINAAGAWAGTIGHLAGISIPVRPSPRFQVVTEPQQILPPTTPLIVDLATGGYARAIKGRVLAGAAPATIPVGFSLTPSADDLETIATRISIRFPGLRHVGVSRVIAGLYEVTPDGLPIASFGEHVAGFCTVAGFNGHGIMHSPGLACAMADMIVQGRSDRFDLAPFSARRFADGSPRRRNSSLI